MTKCPAPLKNIATFERTTVPTEVAHHRIRRVMDVFANVSGRAVGSVAAEIQRAVERHQRTDSRSDPPHIEVPDGYFVHYRGEVASMSFMGVIFLVGIAVSNTVLVVDFASRVRALSAPEAVLEAGAARLRPVLMTALAAMLALTPMALPADEATMPLVPMNRD